MNSTIHRNLGLLVNCLVLAGCLAAPAARPVGTGPDRLLIRSDGLMEFRNRPVADDDVIIYSDGYGGEKAALRVRMEPLHPDFFHDSIVVERE